MPHRSPETSSRARACLPDRDRDQISLDSALLVVETSACQFAPGSAYVAAASHVHIVQPHWHKRSLTPARRGKRKLAVVCAGNQKFLLRPQHFRGTET